jgi:hemoglobin-like flavoprotein
LVGTIFYRRLFEIDPNLRPMFSQVSMKDQIHKLVTMLDLVIHWARRPGKARPGTQAAG